MMSCANQPTSQQNKLLTNHVHPNMYICACTGIFISRVHDSLASDALQGLLGIGDRIVAIDECAIEPDHDILRVNQLISKKTKITLKVKPYKC